MCFLLPDFRHVRHVHLRATRQIHGAQIEREGHVQAILVRVPSHRRLQIVQIVFDLVMLPALPDVGVLRGVHEADLFHFRRQEGQMLEGRRDDDVHEAHLRRGHIRRRPVAERGHGDPRRPLGVALLKEFEEDSARPPRRNVEGLRRIGNVGAVQQKASENAHRGIVRLPLLRVRAVRGVKFLELPLDVEVLGHVRAQHHVHHLPPENSLLLAREARGQV
mmetsp:Transcript_85640/g.262020  ORF Transcript_85640/g.262020 Transcript_85640/m.262020 type:complete len:220 (-) Transcript_85640:1260-1919(-)